MKRLALALVLALATSAAWAATTKFSIVVTSSPSTSVTCTVSQSSFVAPVAAGTTVASCAVLPTTWSGVLTLGDTNGGADAALFGMSQGNIVVGSAPLTAARTYNLTVTATP